MDKCCHLLDNRGFTLVEVMIAITVSAILTIVMYTALQGQQTSYLAQEQVSETHQTLRVAMRQLARELRMAGYDPTGKADAGILTAIADQIQFTMDRNEDKALDGPEENITFKLNGSNELCRDVGAGAQPIAENIIGLEFNYVLKNGTEVTAPSVLQIENIRSVEVTALAESEAIDRSYEGVDTFTTPAGTVWGPFNDGHRRQMLSMTVNMRNMGLDD